VNAITATLHCAVQISKTIITPGSRAWQQDRHHGRRAVWLLSRLTQNPAGLCRQWMHSWMVCSSRRGVATVRRRELVVLGASPFRSAATLAAAACSR